MRHMAVPVAVLGLGLSAACGPPSAPASRPPEPMDAEMEVATTALLDFVGEPDSTGRLLLSSRLEARTASFPDSAAWTAATDSFGLSRVRYPDLVARYWQVNREPRALRRAPRIPGWRVELVEPETDQAPGRRTIHYLSRVGVATNGDSALVAVDAICGALCGRGVLALYVRHQDGWRLASLLQVLHY